MTDILKFSADLLLKTILDIKDPSKFSTRNNLLRHEKQTKNIHHCKTNLLHLKPKILFTKNLKHNIFQTYSIVINGEKHK